MSIVTSKSQKLILQYNRSSSALIDNKKIALQALKENNNLDLDLYEPFIKEFHIYSNQAFCNSLF